ncbi:amidohydrolase [Oscillospiraceae bacterium CM]|nr:amidohydrolase [Oscillospiraceae bacterium CM]
MSVLIRDILAILPEGAAVCSVAVENGVITAVGDVPKDFRAEKTILGSGKMLIPGLINAHTHAYMTLFRNVADDLTFHDWLFGRILPLEDQLTHEDCYWGSLLGIMEMLSTGTTAFNDMYIFVDAAAQAVYDSGMRAVLSRGLVGDRENAAGGAQRLHEAKTEIEKWRGYNNISFMLAPHAPYTCDDIYQKEVAEEAHRLGVRIHTHLSESQSEMAAIRASYGCTPPELYDKTGLLSDKTVAAHCVYLTDDDIALLARCGVSVATNPVSNLKLANGIAPIPKMLKAGINVALGTDGPASNNTLNMFRELAFLTALHKGTTGDPQAVTAREGLQIATINGARALGLTNVGAIKPGMAADLAIIDLDRPNLQPLNDPVAALAYSMNGSEVETVLVGGKILMENRRFLTIDRDRVLHEVSRVCERIGTR